MRNVERFARNVRNENRTTVTVGNGEPSPNEGNEGDIRINTTTGGLKLFAKYKGQWYETGLAKVLNRPERISVILDETGGTSSNTVNDTTSGVKDDIAALAAKINEILDRLQ